MHAIRQHEFGPAETLRYEEVPDPVPGAEQVRIAVEAAGLHLIDTKIRAGFSGGLRELETRALAEAAASRLVPLVGRRFPLAGSAAAHEALETRATEGKTVLAP